VTFNAKNLAQIPTKVESGKSYLLNLTVQARAKNLSESAQLLIIPELKGVNSGLLSQLLVLPSHGVNEKGEIVQTIQITGLFQPKVDSETLTLTVTEKLRRNLSGLIGVVQLTKVNVQVLNTPKATSNLMVTPVVKAPTTKAPTTKAPTTKAPTTKAPTTKAPTTKAPTTKAPTTKAPTTKAPTTKSS
jgi:hypothetical protein